MSQFITTENRLPSFFILKITINITKVPFEIDSTMTIQNLSPRYFAVSLIYISENCSLFLSQRKSKLMFNDDLGSIAINEPNVIIISP
jgi:hypothetical protein